jgi:hypothetical protein
MTSTTLSALSSSKKLVVSVSFIFLVLSFDAVRACAQWPWPWPDSNTLPAGATQCGNVFPGGNLLGGGKAYTPANFPQRYLYWGFENPYNGFPKIYGALDSAKATYRDVNGTLIVGADLYNLRGLTISQTSCIPTSVSDPRWDRWRNGNVQGYFEEGVGGNPGQALIFGQDELVVFQIDNTGDGCPNAERHAWISFNYCNVAVEGDSPMVVAFGAGTAIDGWYHLPANPEALQWGCYGFAVTITNDCSNVSFAIGDLDSENLYIDNLQIAAVAVPEPSIWKLIVLGWLVPVLLHHWLRKREMGVARRPQHVRVVTCHRSPRRYQENTD